MRLWSLASGSSGNCFLLESEGTRILVECGRPMPEIVRSLRKCGVDPAELDAMLLTHAHGDHACAASEMADAYHLPIYASAGTLGASILRGTARGRPIEAERPFRIGEIEVVPFSVPHDCIEPLGFRFESESARACIATDLGWVPEGVQAHLPGLDLLVLEANYEPRLLAEGRYPAFLKRRVGGRLGHLANGEAARAIAACGDQAPPSVWLAHISEQNNSRDQALRSVRGALRQRGLEHVVVSATTQRRPSLTWNSRAPERQLSLW